MFYLLIALVVVLDQVMKYYIRANMDVTESVPLWEGVINLTSHRNPGAAFGILEGQQWFFILSTAAVVVGVIYFRAKGELKGRPLMEIGLALLMGGAIGNAIDRVLFGVVTDFFDLQFVSFAIFNIADVAINIGVGLMILSMLIEWLQTRKSVSREEEA
ncbi:signal peptidase II [Tumebacillus algifaecis]|uniref:Lipoprotein signal peptidase n=1 Tax=Tumebacillus algifaecis TaxID=1214604 RepID=A0A223D6U6_9BACL|nr:signal peptidase II [Tumebacillus algifaecis]